MKSLLDRRRLLIALALLAAGGGSASADDGEEDDEQDHDRARRALEEGKVRPLAEILAEVRHRLGGEVIGAEFDLKGGRYVYEFKVVAAGGRLREIYVDATTAEILAHEDN